MNPVISPVPIRRDNLPNEAIFISTDKIPESSVQNNVISLASVLDQNSTA